VYISSSLSSLRNAPTRSCAVRSVARSFTASGSNSIAPPPALIEPLCAPGASVRRSKKPKLTVPTTDMPRSIQEPNRDVDHKRGVQTMPKRRANHEGTIYKRQDGRWVASVTLPGGKRKSFYGQTRQEVAQKLTVGLKARLDGMPLPSEQLKVGRYLQEWLQTTQPSVRPTTWLRYKQLICLHALPALGTLQLTRLEPRQVQKLYADLLAQGQAPASVRQLHAVLRRAFSQAVKWGTVARNVIALVTPPRVARHEIQPLTAAQARALLEAARGERLEA